MSSRWFWSAVRVPAVVLGLLLVVAGGLDLAGLYEDAEVPRGAWERIAEGLLSLVAGLALALPYSRLGRPLRLACLVVVVCIVFIALNVVMLGLGALWDEHLNWGALALWLVLLAIPAGSVACLRAYSVGAKARPSRTLAQDARAVAVSALLLGASILASYHAMRGLDIDRAWTHVAFLAADWPIWPVLALLPAAAAPESLLRSLACVAGAAAAGTIVGIALVVSTTCMIFDLGLLLLEAWSQLLASWVPVSVALLIGLAWRETGGWPHPAVGTA